MTTKFIDIKKRMTTNTSKFDDLNEKGWIFGRYKLPNIHRFN